MTPGLVSISSGQNPTSINRGTSTQTYQVRHNIHIQLKGGDDWFTFVGNGGLIPGDIEIDDSNGQNHALLTNLQVGDSLRIDDGDGSSELGLDGLSIRGKLRVNMGAGGDHIDLRSSTTTPLTVGKHTDINMGRGEDRLSIGMVGNVRLFQSLDVDMGHDSDWLSVGPGTELRQRFKLDGGRSGSGQVDTLHVPGAAAFDPDHPGRPNRIDGFEVVLTAALNPSAVDDAFTIPADSANNLLDVLANDSLGALGGQLRILQVGTPSQSGTVVISADQQRLVYTPLPGFFGTETLSYAIADGNGGTASATVTITVPDLMQPLVRYRAEITDPAGNPLGSVAVGQPFLLSVIAQDLRFNPRIVFAAYLDVTYGGSGAAMINGPIQFNNAEYPNAQHGDTSLPGLIDEVGAIDGIAPQPAPDGIRLFSLPFVATQVGQLVFAGNPADVLPIHETVLFGAGASVPADRMEFVGGTLQIVDNNTAPSLAPIPNVTLLAGAPLHLALDGFDAEGDAITYEVVSGNPSLVQPIVSPNTNRSMRIQVANYGTMVFHLFEDLVPRITDNIIAIAQAGTYDGVIFHRVVKNDGQGNPFVIQGGDPNGNGVNDEAAPEFDDQYHVDLQHTSAGLISMAKAGDDTNTSQFFITAPTTQTLRRLDFNHSVFGQLVEGESVRQVIQQVPTGAQDRPITDVVMQHVDVFLDQENGVLRLKAPEGASGQATITVTARDAHGAEVTQTFDVTVQPDTFNGTPFLNDIGPVSTTRNTPVSFVVSSQDVENSAVIFAHVTQGGQPLNNADDPTLPFDVVRDDSFGDAFTTRFTVTPPTDFVGTLRLLVGVSSPGSDTTDSFDRQRIPIQVVPGP